METKNFVNMMMYVNIMGRNPVLRFAPNVGIEHIHQALMDYPEMDASMNKSREQPGLYIVRANVQESVDLEEITDEHRAVLKYFAKNNTADVLQIDDEENKIGIHRIATREGISIELMLIRRGLALLDMDGKLLMDYKSLCDIGLIVPVATAPVGASYIDLLYDDDISRN